jgi:hypothetical protein
VCLSRAAASLAPVHAGCFTAHGGAQATPPGPRTCPIRLVFVDDGAAAAVVAAAAACRHSRLPSRAPLPPGRSRGQGRRLHAAGGHCLGRHVPC